MQAAVEAMTGKTLMGAWSDMAEVLSLVCPDATDEELEAMIAVQRLTMPSTEHERRETGGGVDIAPTVLRGRGRAEQRVQSESE